MNYDELINEAIEKNAKAVEQVKAGKDKALNAIAGYVFKNGGKEFDPQEVVNAIRSKLGLLTFDVRAEKEQRRREKDIQESIEREERKKKHYVFGVLNTIERNREYGVTRYFCETQGKRIEFLHTEVNEVDIPEDLKKYLKSLIVHWE